MQDWDRTIIIFFFCLCMLSDGRNKNVNKNQQNAFCADILLCLKIYIYIPILGRKGGSTQYLAQVRLRWPERAWLLSAASRFPSGCGKWQRGVRPLGSSAALPGARLNVSAGFMPWSPARKQHFRTHLWDGRAAACTCVSVTDGHCVLCYGIGIPAIRANTCQLSTANDSLNDVCVCVDSILTVDFGCLQPNTFFS